MPLGQLMSIIYLTTRCTNNIHEFERLKESDDSKIYCSELPDEPFVIVLTLGDQWASNVTRSEPKMYKIEDSGVEIPRNGSVVVEVKQDIRVPHNMYGFIIQKGHTFLEDGIIVSAGKVDPGFSGILQLLLFNSSKRHKVFKKGEEMANLIFIRTDNTVQSPVERKRQIALPKKKSLSEKVSKFLSEDKKFTVSMIITIFTSGIVACLTVYLSYLLQTTP